LPAAPGKSAVELFDALADGSIKAVWIACTNPAQSLPDQQRIAAALQRAEFVVVQEAYADTETCAFADLVLPAASWGEKEGTVTNSERRISRLRAAVPAPGEARADWQIATDFARRLGAALGRDDALRLFPYTAPAQIFAEHAALTAGRDLDFAALDYARLDAEGPLQWPITAAGGTPRLYTDGRFAHADGRARFVPITLARTAESTDAKRPLALNTGRLRDQWHGMSRTGTVPRLGDAAPEATLALNPADIARRGLKAGELVGVAGRRGRIVLPLAADPTLKPGHAFVPMHWGRARLGHAGVNALTTPAFDPVSKQPELKHAAVAVEAVALPWRGEVLFAPADTDAALAARVRLAPLLDRFAFAALSLSGRERPLLTLRLADGAAPETALLAAIEDIVGLASPDALHFEDAQRAIRKRARIDGERLAGVALFGETAAAGWLREAMLTAQSATPLRRWLFAPCNSAPIDSGPRPQVLCQCLDVTDVDLAAAVAAGCTTFEAAQARLRCGSGCGGCVPAMRQKFAALLAVPATPT
jgi:assimilatory nitrate reductase catalytic subunit